LAQEKLYLEEEIRSEMNFENIVGSSPALTHVLELVETVAPNDSTVLLFGETGTGKELIARAIHDRPALVSDRYWNVIRTNEAAPRFFGSFVDLEARPRPRNLLDLIFDPAGMRPFVEHWEAVAAGLLQRVSRESVGHVVDQKTVELLKKLEKYPGVKTLGNV
jgi:AAA+ superfamily predicted ATPase